MESEKLEEAKNAFLKMYIQSKFEENSRDVSVTAKKLGISEANLKRKIKGFEKKKK